MVNIDENWSSGAGSAVGQGDRGGTQKGRSYKFLGRVAECHTIYTDLYPHFMLECKLSQMVQTFQFSSVSPISVTFCNSSFGFPSIMETQSPMLRRLWRQRCWCLEQAWMFFCDTRGNLSQFLKLKS